MLGSSRHKSHGCRPSRPGVVCSGGVNLEPRAASLKIFPARCYNRWQDRWRIVILAVSLLGGGWAWADFPYAVRHWGPEQGLPPGPGASGLQTRDGYVWLGMEEGLARLGGGTATVFDSFNTPEMKGNTISTLFEDREGNLWAGTGKWGLLRVTDGQFKRFGSAAGLANQTVSAIAQDQHGTLWVGTDGGGLFRLAGERFSAVTFPEPDPHLFVKALAGTPDGAVWVAYDDALRRLEGGDSRLFGTNVFNTTRIEALHTDRQGRLWVGGQGFLAREAAGQFHPIPWNARWGRVGSLASDAAGNLWVGTLHGLVRLAETETRVFNTANGLTGDLVTSLLVDREGSVWVSSNASGVDQLKPSRFEVVGTQQGLSHPSVTSVMEASNGDVWIATEAGVNRFSEGALTTFKEEQGLSWNMVFTLAEGGDGTLWAGTWKGLNRFEDGAFQQVDPIAGYPSGTTWCAYRDADGTMWFGTPRGLAAYRSGEFQTWNHENSGLSHDDVRCILRDREGTLWVGTSYGLNRLEGDRFQSFFEAAEDQSFNVVLSLHEDADGGLWFGTQGDGLFLHREGKFFRFTTAEGLYDNLVFAIVEDDSGYLWLTSNRGLFRVSRAQLEAVARGDRERVAGRAFTQADGLPTAAFNGTVQPAAWKARDGRLWFATLAGAVAVAPGRMFTNLVPPAVSIESVAVNGRPGAIKDGSLVVPPGAERLAFSYAVLSYVSPDALRSRYRLEGFDRQWITNAGRHEVQYTALRPGAYQFRVAAANGDGVWNEAGVSLAVLVQPFLWQTPWFQAAAGVLLLGLLVGAVHILMARHHRLTLEAIERRHALERERMRIASDLHDDVGSNLGSIALLSRDVERRATADPSVAEDLSEISRLAQETSESMRDIVWFINPDEDTVGKLLLRMKDVAANLLGGIRFVFEAPDTLASTRLTPQFKRQFFLIYKEALHNICKHASAAKVVIRLRTEAGRLWLEIQDDGVGFVEGKTGHGHGLANLRRRAAECRWTLEISSEPGRGTRIRLVADCN